MTDTSTDPILAIHEAAQANYTRVRANQSLTRPAVMKQLAAAHVKAQAQLDSMKAKADADTTARQNELSTKLMGIGSIDPSAAISQRDALDRVAAIARTDTRTATTMLADAQRSGDTAMQKAILGRAFSTGDADLANQYTSGNPQQSQVTPGTGPMIVAVVNSPRNG